MGLPRAVEVTRPRELVPLRARGVHGLRGACPGLQEPAAGGVPSEGGEERQALVELAGTRRVERLQPLEHPLLGGRGLGLDGRRGTRTAPRGARRSGVLLQGGDALQGLRETRVTLLARRGESRVLLGEAARLRLALRGPFLPRGALLPQLRELAAELGTVSAQAFELPPEFDRRAVVLERPRGVGSRSAERLLRGLDGLPSISAEEAGEDEDHGRHGEERRARHPAARQPAGRTPVAGVLDGRAELGGRPEGLPRIRRESRVQDPLRLRCEARGGHGSLATHPLVVRLDPRARQELDEQPAQGAEVRGLFPPLAAHELGEPEVLELDTDPVGVLLAPRHASFELDGLGAEVAVRHAPGVSVLEALEDLAHDLQGVPRNEGALAVEQCAQALTVDAITCHPRVAGLGDPDLPHAVDGRVGELAYPVGEHGEAFLQASLRGIGRGGTVQHQELELTGLVLAVEHEQSASPRRLVQEVADLETTGDDGGGGRFGPGLEALRRRGGGAGFRRLVGLLDRGRGGGRRNRSGRVRCVGLRGGGTGLDLGLRSGFDVQEPRQETQVLLILAFGLFGGRGALLHGCGGESTPTGPLHALRDRLGCRRRPALHGFRSPSARAGRTTTRNGSSPSAPRFPRPGTGPPSRGRRTGSSRPSRRAAHRR